MFINNHHIRFSNFQSLSMLKSRQFSTSSSKSGFFGSSSSSMFGSMNSINSAMRSAQSFMSVTTVEITRISITISAFISKSKNDKSVFDKTAISSDPDLLEIKSFDGKTLDDTKVKIDQIATTQKNTGKLMNVNANPAAPKDGVYRFEIEVDGVKHELSFTTDGKETNKSFQQKMADAVNEADIGVTASVTTDEDGKNNALNLESNTTGAGKDGQPLFTVRDIEGNAVEITGIGTVTQEAQDAIYSVNGGEKQISISNDVDLGNGVIVTLKGASDKEVSVTFGKDTKVMKDGLCEMVDCYNNMLDAAKNNQGDKYTSMFMMRLEVTVVTSKTVLKQIGINSNSSGYLSVDYKKMTAAAESGAIENFFTGDKATGRNFIEQMQKLFDDFYKNPWQFVNQAFDRFSFAGSLMGDNGFSGFNPSDFINRMLDVKS